MKFGIARNHMSQIALALWVIGFSFVQPALAELNGSASSVEVDRQFVTGTMNSKSQGGSTVFEITDSNGTQIREYVSPAGRVFAIAWEGHFLPDLRQFLGSEFQQYSAALHSEHKNSWRRSLLIRTPTLAFEIGGHMGWFYGVAYVPASLPDGFLAEEIH